MKYLIHFKVLSNPSPHSLRGVHIFLDTLDGLKEYPMTNNESDWRWRRCPQRFPRRSATSITRYKFCQFTVDSGFPFLQNSILKAKPLTSHSDGARRVSSKLLMSNMMRRSGVAKPPKFMRWQSPQECTQTPDVGILARSVAMIAAAGPR